MRGSDRSNLLQILKQQSQAQLQQENAAQAESQYYLDTLQGTEGEDGGPHTLSVNRFDGRMPIPVPMPEQDLNYDSEHNFNARRNTQRNQKLEPLKVKHSEFLRRGRGNGGSPTTHAVGKTMNDSGIVTLSPIGRKKAAHSNVRIRDKAGGY